MLLAGQVFSQQRQDIQNYVATYKDIAVAEMVRTGIPASITLAQGILESGCGKSELSTKANNHFGIKCKDEWPGKKFYQDDDAPNECFRVYESARESYDDHSNFLQTRPRYASLFKLQPDDYKGWATGLKEAGYATNPKYPTLLIGYIETYELHQYDKIGLALIEANKNNNNNEHVLADKTNEKQRSNNSVITVDDVKKEEKVIVNGREEYTVNGIRALRAKTKEDPFAIAYEYNIPYEHILAFNDLTEGDKFMEGEYIFLQTKKSRGSEASYKVKEGESMHDVAQNTGIKLRDLYSRNQMRMNDQPYAGEVLYLQERSPGAPRTMSYSEYLTRKDKLEKAAKERAETDRKKAELEAKNNKPEEAINNTPIQNVSQYEVQQKDTLYSIARKFNTTVDQIKEDNGLDGNYLKPGQTLVIAQ